MYPEWVPPASHPTRLVVISLLLGGFVLADFALFGWLIFRSLSQREVERVLLETRAEAQTLAERIAGRAKGRDLYTAVTMERETRTYIESVLRQRDIVRAVEIRDKDGMLVFRTWSMETAPTGAPALAPPGELPPRVQRETVENRSTYDVTVPIGDVGSLRIGISEGELTRRVEGLRRDLVRQAATTGALTLVVLIFAYAVIWRLWRRAQRLEEHAADAERLATIGTLASGLAHEIRNPLNSLNLNMQLLEEDLDDPRRASSTRRLLSITHAEIRRLERLVTDFLSYAKPRALELEEVAPVELLEHQLQVAAGQIQSRNARVEIEDRSEGARVMVDRAQMGQLLLNLVQNALGATEESGRTPQIRLAAGRQGTRVVLEVTDNGVGIPPDEQPRVFDAFYSTRRGGTGLGLAIVERIARAHGAELGLRSAPGEGTTITLSLPAVEAREAVPEAALAGRRG
jgi:signal transduction histidine kinase